MQSDSRLDAGMSNVVHVIAGFDVIVRDQGEVPEQVEERVSGCRPSVAVEGVAMSPMFTSL